MFPLSASITTRNLVYFWDRNFYNLVRGSPLNFAFFYREVCRRRGPVDGWISLNLSAPSLSPLLCLSFWEKNADVAGPLGDWSTQGVYARLPREFWIECYPRRPCVHPLRIPISQGSSRVGVFQKLCKSKTVAIYIILYILRFLVRIRKFKIDY